MTEPSTFLKLASFYNQRKEVCKSTISVSHSGKSNKVHTTQGGDSESKNSYESKN